MVGGEPGEDTIVLNQRGDVNCDGFVRAAVMGDSYISGEGAYGYLPGTDNHGAGKNLCHRSPTHVAGAALEHADRRAARSSTLSSGPNRWTATGSRSSPARAR